MRFALFRRGRIWHYRYQVAGRPRVQRSTGETSRAKAQAVAEEAFRAAQLRARGEEPTPTLRALVVLWLEAHRRIHSAAHLRAVELFGRCHLYELGDLTLDRIRTADVEAARALHLEDHAPSSANHWLRILSLLFGWAIRRRMIRVREWEVRPIKVQRRPRTILAPQDTKPFLAAFDQGAAAPLRLALRLALGLGLREGEALGARWEWLDLRRQTYTPGRTKGREAVPIPVPDWLAAGLRPQARRSGWIAPRPETGKPYAPGALRHAMHKANAKLGLRGLTPHRLRGTFATLLSEAGVPIQDIQRTLRHKKPETTMGYLETDWRRVSRGQAAIASEAGLAKKGNR